MKLVIAEKPSVARNIAKIIGANKKQEGYLYGNNYIVSWCVGHLVGLANPDEYDSKYSKWRYEDLPIIPEEWTFNLNPGTEKQFSLLDKMINSDKVNSIVVATDAGREGELIFRLVYNMTGSNKPFERLWISSMEDSAIREGFENLKPGHDYDRLYDSALSRAKADWIVGMNGTRLFTTMYNSILTVGRVQTPTLAMIAERDYKIDNFIQDKFYHIELTLGGNQTTSATDSKPTFTVKSEKFDNESEAEKLMKFCDGKKANITKVKKKVKRNKPPLLFDLTTLQREANRLFGFTAKQTLDCTQNLYEKKIVTYPRTDSRYITEDVQDTLTYIVKSINPEAKVNTKRVTNSSKVTDHHAIIPTRESVNKNISSLPKNERYVFELIKMKIQSATNKDYAYEQVTVIAKVENVEFKALGRTDLELGFKKIEDDFKAKVRYNKSSNKSNDNSLPVIKKGEIYDILNIEKKDGLSSPPKHFTEDTLLSAMERAGNEDLDKSLDTEKKGLGTPATRAGIIEKLLKVGYVKRDKKNLLVTDKGTSLIEVIPENLKSAQRTAHWENTLTEISKGSVNSDEFISDIEKEIKELVVEVPKNKKNVVFKNERKYSKNKGNKSRENGRNSKHEDTRVSLGKCPRCGSPVYESDKVFYCDNRECEFAMFKSDNFFEKKKKKLTKTMAKAFLSKGRVDVKKLYSEKKDTYYDATVVLEDTGKWVNYKLEFNNSNQNNAGANSGAVGRNYANDYMDASMFYQAEPVKKDETKINK